MKAFSHPAFTPYRELIHLSAGGCHPQRLNDISAQLDICHAHNGKPLRFSAQAKPAAAHEYEEHIAATGVVPTREDNLHDYLNALVWLRFPHLKSAINRRHCELIEQSGSERKQRGKVRDRLTLLDESGALVASDRQDLLAMLSGKLWPELFWQARNAVEQHMLFIVIGHGLLEKCLSPFSGMTAKCMLLHTPQRAPHALDSLAASALSGKEAPTLPPLPIQGIPGWSENNQLEVYLDTNIFRPARTP